MQRFHLTKAGLLKLQEELEGLRQKRPQLVESIASAREQGDLSENSEYQTAKEEHDMLESRIKELENIVKNANIIDNARKHSAAIVGLGSTVCLKDLDNSTELTYTLVGTVEADPFEQKISDESPIGQILIGKKVGDQVALPRSGGELVCKIEKIQ